MKFAIVSVKDAAVDAFGVPQFVPSIGFAQRGFADEVNREDAQNLWFRHPEQFVLYELGEYDDNGSFALLPEPREIVRGRDVARQNAPGHVEVPRARVASN